MFGERAVLKLMYAALVRAAERWRGIKITELERRQLEVLRQQLKDQHAKENEPVTQSNTRSAKVRRLQQR